MIRPVRLQLSRKRGFNLQRHSLSQNGLHAINCARPTKWSNPFTIAFCQDVFDVDADRARGKAVLMFEDWIDGILETGPDGWTLRDPPKEETIRQMLCGHNLACWCGLDQFCHADILLKIANPEEIDRA